MRQFSLLDPQNIIINYFIGLIISCFLFSACSVPKNSYYFKNLPRDTAFTGLVTNNFESKIRKKDVLAITISSLNKEMDERFNTAGSLSAPLLEGGSVSSKGYLVDEMGTILIHHLGRVAVEGLTRRQLQEKLQKDLLPYMKEPIVNIQYLNHKVTILGEIAEPKVLNMPEEGLSLIDVIVSAGDIKPTGNRQDIMIIRETEREKTIKHLNLEDNSVFSSAYYYLQPNDIVYILPENEKYMRIERRKSLQTTLSLVASGVSFLVTILNILLR